MTRPIPADLILLAVSIATAVLLAVSVTLVIVVAGLRMHNERRALHDARVHARWEPVLLDVLAGAAAIDDIIAAVRPGEGRSFLEFLFRYARLLSGEDRAAVSEIARPFLGHLQSELRSRAAERRARAVQLLSTLDLDGQAATVLDALHDPSPLVAMVAARALAKKDHPEHIDAVLGSLHRFDLWNPNFLASMLASVGIQVAPSLRRFLSDPEGDPRVRAVAGDALRLLGDPAAADAAAAVLGTERDRELRAAALRLLEAVGRPAHLAAVRAVLSSPDFVLRAHAASALGRLSSGEDTPLLEKAVHDPSPWVALHAGRALAGSGRLEFLQDLAHAPHPRAKLAREVLAEAAR